MVKELTASQAELIALAGIVIIVSAFIRTALKRSSFSPILGYMTLGALFSGANYWRPFLRSETLSGLGYLAQMGVELQPLFSLGELGFAHLDGNLTAKRDARGLSFVMRADNNGEGGIIALVALLKPWRARPGGRRYALMLLGLFGASLLYGDGTITPAISVLSAVEGLEVAAPALEHFVLPVTVTILGALFLLQSQGTERIGRVFGPTMLVWFGVIAALGIIGLALNPGVLGAVNPLHAVRFFETNGSTGFMDLGAVFLVVTGGEALYADMGHFGRSPIRFSWFTVALPALLLNYFGQGALLLTSPSEITEPFYHLAPSIHLV